MLLFEYPYTIIFVTNFRQEIDDLLALQRNSFLQMMPYLRLETEKMYICLELLRERLQPVGYVKRRTIVMLANKLFFQFLNKKMELKEALGILGKMEVLEDESTEN